jgi:DNA-directed RNA polymerase specialized sigma subunit
MTVYTVRAEREGKWWGLQCVEVPSALSQSRDLAGAQVIREAIAFIEEIPEYTVAINLDVVLPADMKSTLDEYRGLVARETEINAARYKLQKQLITDLTKKTKLSFRDVAELLGISHQRVGQLAPRDDE